MIAESEVALSAHEVRKRYGGLVVLDGVSLSLRPGARLGVIGPNGSGKTTLLNVLGGYISAHGSIKIRGQDVSRASASRRAGQGMARTFQVAAVVDEWSVYDNLAFAAAAHLRLGLAAVIPLRRNAAVRAHVVAAADRWELSESLQAPIRSLAYGMVRRTELAMGTMGDPDILLLDEPAAGLSAEDGVAVVGLVNELFARSAIILVEHDMDVVFGFCEEILVLDQGRVIAHGDPASVRNDPAVTAAYLGTAL